MCYLISISATGFDGSLTECFRTHGLIATPTKNPSVLRALGGAPYNVTDGHCSCSFYVDPAIDDRTESRLGAARARYEKKGWSKAKTDRALSAKAGSRSHSTRASEFDFPGAVHSLLVSASIVQLLCHAYSGRFDDEPFDVEAKLRLEPASLQWQRVYFPKDAVVTLVSG
jgi:hypothetical protein